MKNIINKKYVLILAGIFSLAIVFSFPNATYAVGGQCGSSLNSCKVGKYSDRTDSATHYVWTCTGTNGCSGVTCTSPKPATPAPVAPKQNAVCGTYGNYCQVGYPESRAESATHYNWVCKGINGGSWATCSSAKPVPPPAPINGACGSAKYTCNSGSVAGQNENSGSWWWYCAGANGGSHSSTCSINKPIVVNPVNGQCGNVNGKTRGGVIDSSKSHNGYFPVVSWGSDSTDDDTRCSIGSVTSLTQPTPSNPKWTWTCSGSNGGSNSAVCTLNATRASGNNGSCGSAAKSYSANDSGFSGSFCSSGTASPSSPSFPSQGGSTSWTCNGSNGGSNATCSASRGSTSNNDDLEAECKVSDTSIESGDRVRVWVSIDGGDSPYDVKWSGDADEIDDFDDEDEDQYVEIEDEGRYELRVTVTDDDGNRVTDYCPIIRVEDEDDDDLDIQCRVSDTSIDEGDDVKVWVDIDGGDSPYEIKWSGDANDIDDFDDDKKSQTVEIDESGEYRLKVTVEDDDGNKESEYCSVIKVGKTSDTGELASISSVYLSQIPYTGPEDTIKVIGYVSAIFLWSSLVAYAVIKNRKTKLVSKRIESFKNANRASKTA